ncbi:hypothetical protein PCC9214_01353 [Planktothrix tepida]|uniref:DUF3082 domain-containing protein n=2 Tax=Planktothrix TaxID=54304 RepID=A0A1J1LGE9_9CYAN|nr:MULTISPECIES: DUF3082 domain-containing protein [Planktothrix]CAD5932086.1 hypothetical protein PCC9214_01353 [Planktothrix tepida]CAD5978505.1 hypothetical protein NO713_04403 [Planktothrix pseudagardhii]CUR31647.1 conserved hypothetical protein [Planktothrix tepida PCC 9214]
MTEPTSKTPQTTSQTDTINLFRCITNGLMYGGVALVFYKLTHIIAEKFANKPIQSENFTVIQISTAVRTLVVGLFTMGTVLFSFLSVGVMLLAIYVSIQRLIKPNVPSSNG